jgi:uncharacterized membrane protein YdbT with pleckstrin-like domain
MADEELRNDTHRDLPDADERRADRPRASVASDKLRPGRQLDDEPDAPEQQLWQGGYSSKAMVGTWLLGALVSFVLLGVLFVGGVLSMFTLTFPIAMVILALILALWIWLGGIYLYRRMSVQYELTTQRFLHREGILSRRTERIEVIDMDDITCTQGFIQRMVGVGTIKIESSDRTHPELLLKGIDEANKVADLLDDVRRKERRRRGLHIESI